MKHNINQALGSFVVILCLFGMSSPAGENQGFFIRNSDRVMFYGDSITDTEWYPTLVQTYILTRHPQWRNEFFNRGRSGDSTESLDRFEENFKTCRPQAVVFMMGYNDGRYQRFTSAMLTRFLSNVEKSVALARASEPGVRFMLVSSPPNEAFTSMDMHWASREYHPYKLLMFSRAEQELAARLNVGFVDMTTLYGQTVGLGRILAGNAFAMTRDGVHPQQEGQTFIAFHLLKAMGADSLVAELEIDSKAGKVMKTLRCKVSDVRVENGIVSFKRTCEALPYPTPEAARPFAFLVELDDVINQDRLVIHGLSAPSYRVVVDGKPIADVPPVILEKGLNLARYADTAMYRQAMKVMEAVRAKDLLECRFWREYMAKGKTDAQGKPKQDLGSEEKTKIEALIKDLEEARQEMYRVCVPPSHEIRVEPINTVIEAYDEWERNDFAQAFLDAWVMPLGVNWNTLSLTNGMTTLVVSNPTGSAKSGQIAWSCSGGWKIRPAQADFAVGSNSAVSIVFQAECDPGAPLIPPPTAHVSWKWTRDWAYPMSRDIELPLQPVLTIAKARQEVIVDGRLDDWSDATRFTLEDRYFASPVIAGKKLLWGGTNDLSSTIMMKWDTKAFYLAAIIRDNEHIQNAPPNGMWIEDMLHLAFAMPQEGKTTGQCELGFGIYSNRDEIVVFSASKGMDSATEIRFKSAIKQDEPVCVYEIAIPWERLAPFIPAEDKTFRFTLAVADADSQKGKGFCYLAWTPGIEYGKNMKDYAFMILGK